MNDIQGAKLELYATGKSGKSIVLIHGVFHGTWAYASLWPKLTGHDYSIYGVCLRGHGRANNITARDKVGYRDYLHDVMTLLDTIEGPKILVGHSLGGLLSISSAKRKDVIAIACLATPLPGVLKAKSLSLLFRYPMRFLQYVLTKDPAVLYHTRKIMEYFFFTENTPASLIDKCFDEVRKQKEPQQLFDELMSMSFQPVNTDVNAITLYGEKDPTVDHQASLKVNQLVGGDLIMVPQMGHDFLVEDKGADYCAKLLNNWIHLLPPAGSK